jgi:hypothetical protein
MARPFAGQPDNKQQEKKQQDKEARVFAVVCRAVAVGMLQQLVFAEGSCGAVSG